MARKFWVAAAVFVISITLRFDPAAAYPPYDDLYHAKRIAYSYHLVRFNADVLRETIIRVNSVSVSTELRRRPAIKEVTKAISKAPEA